MVKTRKSSSRSSKKKGKIDSRIRSRSVKVNAHKRRRTTTIIRRERTDAPSAGVSIEMKNNRGIKEDDWFTPKKVMAYCLIVGLISGTLSIFINSLIVISAAAFVFASITVWYIFGDKFQRWEERRRAKEKYFP